MQFVRDTDTYLWVLISSCKMLCYQCPLKLVGLVTALAFQHWVLGGELQQTLF